MLAEAALRAMGKIVPVLPARLRQRAQALTTSTVPLNSQSSAPDPVDPAVLVALAQACRDHERIAFDYKDAKGAASSRQVEPVQLVNVGNRYYLVAFDLDRDDWRSFRVDRAQNPSPRALRFTPKQVPGGDAAGFVRAGLRRSGHPGVSARIHASVEKLEPLIGRWFEIQQIDEDSCLVSTENMDLRWAAFGLAMSESRVSEVQPKELRKLLDSWSKNLVQGSEE